mmetsp:Transcript_44829/g.109355  ORF Transcript_44829/g.109355 Transcript_44829/m.109355 type:complete len:217 (-) Transcript_44829:709-1359(-)
MCVLSSCRTSLSFCLATSSPISYDCVCSARIRKPKSSKSIFQRRDSMRCSVPTRDPVKKWLVASKMKGTFTSGCASLKRVVVVSVLQTPPPNPSPWSSMPSSSPLLLSQASKAMRLTSRWISEGNLAESSPGRRFRALIHRSTAPPKPLRRSSVRVCCCNDWCTWCPCPPKGRWSTCPWWWWLWCPDSTCPDPSPRVRSPSPATPSGCPRRPLADM